MKKHEKFSLIAITALAPYLVIQSPLVQEHIDNAYYSQTETTLIQNVEDFRWSKLKDVAAEGIDPKSYDGRRIKNTLDSLDTTEYKEKLKDKEFYNLEMKAFKDTKEEITAFRQTSESIQRRTSIVFEEEERTAPIKIDLTKKSDSTNTIPKQEDTQSSEPLPSVPISAPTMESVHEAREKMRESVFGKVNQVSKNFKNNI